MRIPSGKVDQAIYFVAFDISDHVTRKTGLTTFTVQRSRNGAAEVAYTTPTVTEIDATNMPGVYALLIDEDTTIASTSDSEEYCLHITQASMAPVTRSIELYRRDVTSGKTLTVDANSRADSSVGAMAANVMTAAAAAADLTTELQAGLATAAALSTAQTSIDDLPTNPEMVTLLGTADDAVLAAISALNALVVLIDAKTTNLPSDPADQSLIITATDAVMVAIAALNNLSAAQVNAEVVDALNVDTYAEPTGVPAATASIVSKLGRLHQALRNGLDVTATAKTLRDDAGAALWKKTLADDGTTYSESEAGAP